ncbi:hypothetical protein ACFFKC_19935 [Pseudoduganella danionis]|uniref:Sn-glycerol-3-phosphate transporter n=1 Tax=Pseudoduganella danionis TaxID=1890295 RepID=A0ABW9SV03_9BURK|nr:hypothetical protein [Pseudoduganella danionis]MTW34617.1 hypothetical protein [Pseudoduganella danionis]
MKSSLITATCLILAAQWAQAQTLESIPNAPLQELWVNGGFYSYHFQRNKNLNDRNPGLGLEYRFSSVASVTAGRFYNSDRSYSNYAGMYYQPWQIGPVRLGAVAGGFNGYPKMRQGGWFVAAIPTASFEYQRVGVNVAVVPTYKDRLYGAISVQLKFKLSD